MKTVLFLASTSPRRRELLHLSGWGFHVLSVEIDESPLPGEPPTEYVCRMAEGKALAAESQLKAEGIAVAADTTVADGDRVLGKPADPQEAAEMLRQLRGRSHLVHTAIAILRYGEHKIHLDLCTTEVPMRRYSDEEITAYIATGDPFDKAGGYAIQHKGFHPVAGLAGCYANVVGLPLCHLVRSLERLGIRPAADVPARCQERLAYDCGVYEAILAGKA